MAQVSTLLINLDRSTDRLKRMDTRLRTAGLDYHRIDAVDGVRALKNGVQGYSDAAAMQRFGRVLSPGEVGCFLSHVKALERAAETKGFTLVLEDDADVPPMISEILKTTIAQLPDDICLVNLSSAAKHRYKIIDEGLGLARACYYPMLATALLWRQDGAIRFLERMQQITMPVDVLIQHWAIRQRCGAAFVIPPIVPDGATSEIGVSRSKDSERSWFYTPIRLSRLIGNHLQSWRG